MEVEAIHRFIKFLAFISELIVGFMLMLIVVERHLFNHRVLHMEGVGSCRLSLRVRLLGTLVLVGWVVPLVYFVLVILNTLGSSSHLLPKLLNL